MFCGMLAEMYKFFKALRPQYAHAIPEPVM